MGQKNFAATIPIEMEFVKDFGFCSFGWSRGTVEVGTFPIFVALFLLEASLIV
jgi:hypothetical protein